jgi:hypothetical protein
MIHKKDLNIKVSKGTFTLYFDWLIFIHYIYIIIIIIILLLERKKKVENKRVYGRGVVFPPKFL